MANLPGGDASDAPIPVALPLGSRKAFVQVAYPRPVEQPRKGVEMAAKKPAKPVIAPAPRGAPEAAAKHSAEPVTTPTPTPEPPPATTASNVLMPWPREPQSQGASLLTLPSPDLGSETDAPKAAISPLPPSTSDALEALTGARPGGQGKQGAADLTDKIPPQDSAACLAALRALGVPFRLAPPTRGVDTPVVITGPVGGVTLSRHWGSGEALMDCRFAWTMAALAPRIRAAGFDELRYSAFFSYRFVAGSRRLSRHASGMAVDIHEMRGPGGLKAHVEKDWDYTGGAANACQGSFAATPGGRLRQMVCSLEASGLVYLVLTPDSDAAHYNHFHVSGLRPGDRPLTGRVAGVKVH